VAAAEMSWFGTPGGRIVDKRPAVCPIESARIGTSSGALRVLADDTADATWLGCSMGAVQVKPLSRKRL
jgi:hypothetical protein